MRDGVRYDLTQALDRRSHSFAAPDALNTRRRPEVPLNELGRLRDLFVDSSFSLGAIKQLSLDCCPWVSDARQYGIGETLLRVAPVAQEPSDCRPPSGGMQDVSREKHALSFLVAEFVPTDRAATLEPSGEEFRVEVGKRRCRHRPKIGCNCSRRLGKPDQLVARRL